MESPAVTGPGSGMLCDLSRTSVLDGHRPTPPSRATQGAIVSARRRAPRIEDMRAQFLTASDPDHAVPPELLRSWRRSQEALGVPANVRDGARVHEALRAKRPPQR